jgi:hypothetical protein
MKKFILLALAALCVSAAQAVTVNWAKGDATLPALTLDGDFTISITIQLNSLPSSNTQLFMFTSDTGASSFGFGINGGAGGVIRNGSNLNWDGDFSTARIVDNEATFKFTFAENGNYHNVTKELTFYNGNGTHRTGNWNMRGTESLIDANQVWTWDNFSINEEAIKNFSMTIEGNDIKTTVPEPTALALLALGVAGLALRRKA